MYKHEFTVEKLTKLPNQQSNTSWWGKSQELKTWLRLFHHEFSKNRPSAPLKKAKLTITRISSRQPDKDNLYASCKQLIDSLRRLGIITDDAPKHLDLNCEWEKGPQGKPQTRIKIEGV